MTGSLDKIRCLAVVLISMMSAAVSAQERIELEGTRIIGNRELPQVLYIVPWQQAEPVTVTAPPFTSVIDKPLTPIDRMAFQRQTQYHQQLFNNISADSIPAGTEEQQN